MWKKVIHYFHNTLDLSELLPQSAIFGFLFADKEIFQAKNLILLLLKIYLHESPGSKALIFDSFLRKIKKTYVLENYCSVNIETKPKHLKKNG